MLHLALHVVALTTGVSEEDLSGDVHATPLAGQLDLCGGCDDAIAEPAAPVDARHCTPFWHAPMAALLPHVFSGHPVRTGSSFLHGNLSLKGVFLSVGRFSRK